MFFGKSKRTSSGNAGVFAFADQLAAIPVPNARARQSPADTPDSLILEIDLQYPRVIGWAARWLPLRRSKRFQLDGLGLEIFRSLDGRRSAEELIDDFAARYKLTFLEARALVLHFLRLLTEKGLVVVAVKKP